MISPGPTNKLSGFKVDAKISTLFMGSVEETCLKEDELPKLLLLNPNKSAIPVII